jgi:hypothetical protein
MARRKSKRFDAKKELKAIARERVGRVKPARVIVPKTDRKKPKHKVSESETELE